MGDDLANNWGVNLCIPEKYGRSLRPTPEQKVVGSSEKSISSVLPSLLAVETNLFVFERVCICGSQANSWAIDDATDNNASLCLFAAGSYVAGDASALQSYSTSDFAPRDELALIMAPDDMMKQKCRTNTVPFPYFIPGVVSRQELMKYEDDCLEAIHIRLSWAKMRRTPYKAIFLELMLAGNGAVLSNRALVALSRLATFHNLCVIVDEIMTGGRTGQMFYLNKKPVSFQNVVTHITFGKWLKLGMIFMSKRWAEKRKELYPFTARGASTFLCADEAIAHWRTIKSCMKDVPLKREQVLKKLRLKEEDVWGEGLIIFGPTRRETLHGLKCRYLPTIHAYAPFEYINPSPQKLTSEAFRVHINKEIMSGTFDWILDTPLPEAGIESTDAERKLDAERLLDFSFIATLIKSCHNSDEETSEDWRSRCMPSKTNRTQGESALGRLMMSGFVAQTQVGKKRTRKWKLKNGFIAPWKVEDMDAALAIVL